MAETKTPEQIVEDINKGIETIKSDLTKAASKEEVTAVKKALGDLIEANKSVTDAQKAELEDLQEQLNVMKEKTSADKNKGKSVTKTIEDNAEEFFTAFKEGKTHSFTVKADATRASITGNTDAYRDDEISPLATKKLSLYDMFRKVRIGKNNNGAITYRDWDTATTARAAAMVAEGAVFPESTVAWEQKSINIKKIGDTLPITEEFKYDTAMFADEVNAFLNMNVRLIEDTQILSGDGLGENLKGVYTSAATYTAVASGITDASHYDLAVKVAENITKGFGNKFRPNVVLANLTEINKMRLKKDANNNYIMPPFVDRNGNVVAGLTVMEENGLADNTLLVGDTRYGKIYEDQDGYTLSTGYVNDDFVRDIETLKARKRLCLLIKDSEVAGWNKVTSISAALATLATAPI